MAGGRDRRRERCRGCRACGSGLRRQRTCSRARPETYAGGNSRHTRNIRCVHDADGYNSGAYSYDELWHDLCNVGEGPNVEELASFTVHSSGTVLGWMHAHGARWQQPLSRSGRIPVSRGKRCVPLLIFMAKFVTI